MGNFRLLTNYPIEKNVSREMIHPKLIDVREAS